MKGIINQCAVELLKNKFGEDKLLAVLKETGLPEDLEIVTLEDYPDEISIKFITAAAKVLNITPDDVMLAFGDYWVNEFAFKKFKIIFAKYNNAKDFLKGMDSTHRWATETMEGATPPHFEYESPDNNTLIMHYFSKRKLIKILEGLIRGVIKHFNVQADVIQIASNKPGAVCAFKIIFK